MSERLERIKKKSDTLIFHADEMGNGNINVANFFIDMKWLIEQAEHAECLETVLIGTNFVLDETITSLEGMAHSNSRLREALKQILTVTTGRWEDDVREINKIAIRELERDSK